jgi:hypothetical protein
MAPKGSNSIALPLWRWIPSLSPCLLPALPLNLSQILSHVSSDGSSAPTRRQQPAAAGPRPEAFLFLLRLPLRRGTPPRGHRLPRGVRLVVPDLALPPPVAARRHHWRASGPSALLPTPNRGQLGLPSLALPLLAATSYTSMAKLSHIILILVDKLHEFLFA